MRSFLAFSSLSFYFFSSYCLISSTFTVAAPVFLYLWTFTHTFSLSLSLSLPCSLILSLSHTHTLSFTLSISLSRSQVLWNPSTICSSLKSMPLLELKWLPLGGMLSCATGEWKGQWVREGVSEWVCGWVKMCCLLVCLSICLFICLSLCSHVPQVREGVKGWVGRSINLN